MNCQICLKPLTAPQQKMEFHSVCLKSLFGNARVLPHLDFERRAFTQQVRSHLAKGRMSISGVQPKAQMTLDKNTNSLLVTHSDGEFILKPTVDDFPDSAINEHLSMLMAKKAGIQIPAIGLLKFKNSDDQAYVVRRFDRVGSEKLHHEDMMQILDLNNKMTDAKYDAASYQKVLITIASIAGLAVALECFKRIVFNYFIGNDDYHLKNISLMHGPVITMTPLYDSLNSQLYSGPSHSPLALRLIDDEEQLPYYGKMGTGRYGLEDFIKLAELSSIQRKPALKTIQTITGQLDNFTALVHASNLSKKNKQDFIGILRNRFGLLTSREG